MTGITLTNDKIGARVTLYIARDDTTSIVTTSYCPGRDESANLRVYTLPSPFAARAAMVAYARELRGAGYA